MFDGARTMKVLVVEDEESYRQALSSGLGREGFDVVLASDGPEGLRLFDEQHPDIVLLDMLLPGMHGIDVCRRLRSVSAVPILMVSAVDTELDVVLGLELGASGYVTKPFRLRELDRPDARHPPEGAAARHQAAARPPRKPHPATRPARGRLRRRGGGLRAPGGGGRWQPGPPVAQGVRPPGRPPPSRPRVRSRDELIDLLWPDTYLTDTRTLDTHIHRCGPN